MLDRLPIRWRLAVASAILTFAILCGFAIVVGELTQRRIRDDFSRHIAVAADELADRVVVTRDPITGAYSVDPGNLDLFAGAEHVVVRVVTQDGVVLSETRGAPDLGPPPYVPPTRIIHGYHVESRYARVRPAGVAVVQYAQPLSTLDATLQRVRLFLLFGVAAGTGLALLAGVVVARRAMRPIAELTETAEAIRRTRDPGMRVAAPIVDDEIGQLAVTLDGMLQALDASRTETEAMLARQRDFVADASHELRTPLTSVLANLELLADTLHGDHGEAASSALRSARRMRRLVADLLLLARADARREAPRLPVDLREVLVDAAGELTGPGQDHEVAIDAEPVVVDGVRDDLHRLVLNLLENAVRHTPPQTPVCARVRREGDDAVVTIEDEGPGIPPALRDSLFERFVRGAGDRGGSFGLGLAIVRAVAEQHGGTVTVEDAHPGARFVVRLPAHRPAPAAAAAPAPPTLAERS